MIGQRDCRGGRRSATLSAMRCALALLAASQFVAACTSNPDATTPPGRPNIILIVADDLGYGDLGCYGQRITKTPNLDAMASTGMRFTQFYAGSTVCAPSRCVLMTGKHVGRAFIRGNGKVNLLPEHVTVAEVLAENGYRTGLFGKWGIGHEDSTGLPTTGFSTKPSTTSFRSPALLPKVWVPRAAGCTTG